jgi:Triose-phosphate Transporter family
MELQDSLHGGHAGMLGTIAVNYPYSMSHPSDAAARPKTVAGELGDVVTVFESSKIRGMTTRLPTLPAAQISDRANDEEFPSSSNSSSSVDDVDDKDLLPLLKPLVSMSDFSRKTHSISLSRWDTLRLLRLPKGGIGKHLYIGFVFIFFAGSSLGAVFINKTCLTGYHFRYPLTLMLGQMAFAVIVLTILHVTNHMKIPTLHMKDITLMALTTALFTSNVVVGLSALSLVNIPMFSAFRRLTLIFVMGAEYILLKKTHPPGIVCAVIVMTFGAFISAVNDVSFSRFSCFLVFLNNILTALYLAFIKKVMKDTQFEPLPLLYYTALIGFPVVAILVVLTGELSHVITAFKTQPELTTLPFFASLVLTATGAFAVNFSTSLCTHVTSPLTTSVAGQVKNVLQTVLGFFSWGFVPTRMNMCGLLVALGAQLVFAFFKVDKNREKGAEVAEKLAIDTEDVEAVSASGTVEPIAEEMQTIKSAITSVWLLQSSSV